jgi:preprotein translocase SecE subunit
MPPGFGVIVSAQRATLLVVTVLAFLGGWAVMAAVSSAFAQFAVPDDRLLGLLPTSTALGIGAAIALFLGIIRSLTLMTYISEVVGETRRITWPTREEAVRAATTVIGTAVFAACLIAVYDLVWKNLADLVLFTG